MPGSVCPDRPPAENRMKYWKSGAMVPTTRADGISSERRKGRDAAIWDSVNGTINYYHRRLEIMLVRAEHWRSGG